MVFLLDTREDYCTARAEVASRIGRWMVEIWTDTLISTFETRKKQNLDAISGTSIEKAWKKK